MRLPAHKPGTIYYIRMSAKNRLQQEIVLPGIVLEIGILDQGVLAGSRLQRGLYGLIAVLLHFQAVLRRIQIVKAAGRLTFVQHATRGTTIEELAEVLDPEHIAEHLYTAGQPDPDLVIRTSGEQRLGGFLLWQSTHSEFYFCDAYWPAFRKIDFLRALRSYAARHRRFGA